MIYFSTLKKQEKKNGSFRSIEQAAARELLLFALKQEYGMEELPEISFGEKGKPYFAGYPEIHFNYSHCQGGILCGVSDSKIGVDIEEIRNFREGMEKKICHAGERKLLEDSRERNRILTEIWVGKEAWLKYTGEGIGCDLGSLDFSGLELYGSLEWEGCHIQRKFWRGFCLAVCSKDRWNGEINVLKETGGCVIV